MFFVVLSALVTVPRSMLDVVIVTASTAGLINSTCPWKVVELIPKAVIEVTPGLSESVAEMLMSSPAFATLKVRGGIPRAVVELPCGTALASVEIVISSPARLAVLLMMRTNPLTRAWRKAVFLPYQVVLGKRTDIA